MATGIISTTASSSLGRGTMVATSTWARSRSSQRPGRRRRAPKGSSDSIAAQPSSRRAVASTLAALDLSKPGDVQGAIHKMVAHDQSLWTQIWLYVRDHLPLTGWLSKVARGV